MMDLNNKHITNNTKSGRQKTRRVAFSGLAKEESYRFAMQLHAGARMKGESVKIFLVDGKASMPDTPPCLHIPGAHSEISIPYSRILCIVSDRHYISVRCTSDIQKKFRATFRSVTEQILLPGQFLSGQLPQAQSLSDPPPSGQFSADHQPTDQPPTDQQGKNPFLLVNRGVLVNMDHVRSIEKRTLTLDDGSCCTLHSRYAKKITEQYEMYLLRK